MALRIFFVVCLSLCLAACGGQTKDKTAGGKGGSSKTTGKDKKTTGKNGGKTNTGKTNGGKTNGGTTGGGTNGGKTGDPPRPPDSPRLTDGSPLAGLSVPELVARLADSASRRDASDALVAKGDASVDELTKALDSPDWQLRYGAVGTLGQLGADAKPALAAIKKLAAEDDRSDVREAAQFAADAIEGN